MHSDGSGDAGEKNVPLGLMMISIVASLSGFAGVYFEKVLKGSPISLWTRNVHLALFSVATVGLQVISGDFEEACPHSLIEYLVQGLGPVAWAYVIIQAAGGLLIAAVIKYTPAKPLSEATIEIIISPKGTFFSPASPEPSLCIC